MALPSFARFAALTSAAVLALGGPVGADVTPSPSPSASGIEAGTPVIPDGTYRYILFRKPFPDANVEITISNSAMGTAVRVTISDYYDFLYAPVTIQARPKGVPASEIAYHLDGPLGLTAWVAPSNLVADRIDLPGARDDGRQRWDKVLRRAYASTRRTSDARVPTRTTSRRAAH